jgi:predicted nuclease of predicted toxin-antitoxin system
MQLDEIELWLDMQLSPQIAKWITDTFNIKAVSSYKLGLNIEKDENIFLKAQQSKNIFILTKDKDFAELQNRLQSPPKIILLKTGNCTNRKMKVILNEHLLFALEELINTPAEIAVIKPKNLF